MASSLLALLPLLASVCPHHHRLATLADPSLPGGSPHTGGHQRLWQESEGWQFPPVPIDTECLHVARQGRQGWLSGVCPGGWRLGGRLRSVLRDKATLECGTTGTARL